MRRLSAVRVGVVAVTAVALLGVAGCDSHEPDDPYAIPQRFQAYCEEIEAHQARISDALQSGGPTSGLIKALPSFESLAEMAPDDIADDWEVVIGRIHDLVDALDAAGLDPDTYDRRHPPAGLDPAQRDAIDAAAVALVSDATGSAMNSVQQQARDVCKAPLAL